MRVRRALVLAFVLVLTPPLMSFTPAVADVRVGDDAIPLTPPAVDASTLTGKVMFGYQGWYSCPGDGSSLGDFFHWFKGGRLMVDNWPDTDELLPHEGCATGLTLPDGRPALAYSAHRRETVVRHFEWMREYDLDGVFAQRFLSEVQASQANRAFRDEVTRHVRAGAEEHGRVFAIMYDLSGAQGDVVDDLVADWERLVDVLGVTASPRYLHDTGRPVVGIWGIGYPHVALDPEDAARLLAYFREDAAPEYRARVLGGVPGYWRTLEGDSHQDPAWHAVYRSLDVVSPWTVGVYMDYESMDRVHATVTAGDLAETDAVGIDYMPVVWPGFSWHNLYPDQPMNEVPRDGGRYYWQQVANVLGLGARMLYVAMFDELDEGTAMFKLAPTRAQAPVEYGIVTLDHDGEALPSDWYLRLGGATGKALRGEIPLSREIPISFDTTDPTVAIEWPRGGGEVSAGMVDVRGSAQDDVALVRVEARVAEGWWQRAQGKESWSAKLLLPPGSHSIEVRATDSSGRTATQGVRVVAADRTPPSIAITSPDPDVVGVAASVTLRGVASDEWSVMRVEARVGAGSWIEATGTTRWSVTLDLEPGANRVSVRAWDAAGNVAHATATYVVLDAVDSLDADAAQRGDGWRAVPAPSLVAFIAACAIALGVRREVRPLHSRQSWAVVFEWASDEKPEGCTTFSAKSKTNE